MTGTVREMHWDGDPKGWTLARAYRDAALARGLDAELEVRTSYAIRCVRGGGPMALIIEDEQHEHEQTVAAMLAAGVEVEA